MFAANICQPVFLYVWLQFWLSGENTQVFLFFAKPNNEGDIEEFDDDTALATSYTVTFVVLFIGTHLKIETAWEGRYYKQFLEESYLYLGRYPYWCNPFVGKKISNPLIPPLFLAYNSPDSYFLQHAISNHFQSKDLFDQFHRPIWQPVLHWRLPTWPSSHAVHNGCNGGKLYCFGGGVPFLSTLLWIDQEFRGNCVAFMDLVFTLSHCLSGNMWRHDVNGAQDRRLLTMWGGDRQAFINNVARG